MIGAWWIGESDLDGDQKKVIELPLEGRFLVKGPAGSGKTNMLLLRANYLYKSGLANLSVIVFTRSLKGFLNSGAHQYAFPAERIYTFVSFLVRFLSEKGVKYTPSGNFEEDRRFLTQETSRLLEQAEGFEFDALLVDESQDYFPEEIALFGKLAEHLFFVADSCQKIYSGEDAISPIEQLVHEVIDLKFHYRNGRKICNFADDLMKGSNGYQPRSGTSQYDESRRPSNVEIIPGIPLPEQVLLTIKSLENQLRTYPGESLAILCPRREELEAVSGLIKASSLSGLCTFSSTDESIEFSDSKPIIVCTTHASKGLEFTCVHILGAEFFSKFRDLQKKLAYTAITRSKTSLSIYHEHVLPRSLDAACAARLGPPKRPALNSIFGK